MNIEDISNELEHLADKVDEAGGSVLAVYTDGNICGCSYKINNEMINGLATIFTQNEGFRSAMLQSLVAAAQESKLVRRELYYTYMESYVGASVGRNINETESVLVEHLVSIDAKYRRRNDKG